MKKLFKYMCILLFAFFSMVFVGAKEVEAAVNTKVIYEEYYNSILLGRITVNDAGKIKVEYGIGYRDILIYIEGKECVTVDKETKVCSKYEEESNTERYVLFAEGKFEEKWKSLGTIEASAGYSRVYELDSIFDINATINVWAYADFFNEEELDGDGSYDFDFANNLSTGKSILDRIPAFLKHIGKVKNNDEVVTHQKKYPWGTPGGVFYDKNNYDNFTAGNIGNTEIIMSNSSMDENISDFNDMVGENVIPILLAFIAIVSVVTIVVLGVKIVKSSDEPQERSEHVKHLKAILIGLAIIFFLLAVAEPVTDMVKEWMNK